MISKISLALKPALFGLLLCLPFFAYSQNAEPVIITAESIALDKSVALDKAVWKYQAGDDAAWAAKDFDDSAWKDLTNQEINGDPEGALKDWNGRGWFRLRVSIDERLVNQPLALRMWHWGASEIYVDGKLIQSFGRIDAEGDVEFNPRGVFFPVVFATGGSHTIAVRYSLKAERDLTGGLGRWLARGNFLPGFLLVVQSGKDAAFRLSDRIKSNRLDYVFIGLLFAIAFVHFLLFVFHSHARGNLYYSLFVTGLATTILLNRLINDSHFSVTAVAVLDIARQIVQSCAVMSLLAFLYIEFADGFSRFFWLLTALWIVCFVLLIAHISLPFPYFLIALAATLADTLRIIVQSFVGKKYGAGNILTGIVVLVVGVIFNVLFERDLILTPGWLHEINLYIAVLSVPVAVSIYLARSFARTSKNLEEQLVKEVEHEKERARLKIIEAENERRARELDEARQLQLSMLPKKLPQLPNVEVAAYMRPATEVGGDYYDFHVSPDGTLTVAVGDATGHGLKAGTVVTATKGLFNNLAPGREIPETLNQISRSLKAMNLRGLFMAMTLLKIKDNQVSMSVAGMPSVLIYRNREKQVEEISIRAVPLGTVANFPYKVQEFALSAGDSIVVMSDGFPEMFNAAGEILGFEKAAQILPEIANLSPQQIINRFVEVGEQWAGARPQDDDVTFVVLQVKPAQ